MFAVGIQLRACDGICVEQVWTAVMEQFGRLRERGGGLDLPAEALTQVRTARLVDNRRVTEQLEVNKIYVL